MKKLMLLITILSVVCFESSSLAALEAPVLSSSTDGLDITIDWTSVPDATGYELYYVPVASYTGPESVSSIDLDVSTTFNYTLWDGASFYLAVKAYNDQESSPYSNIEVLNIEVVSVPPTAPDLTVSISDLDLSLSWNAVPDATGYILSYVPSPYSGPASFITKDVGGETSFVAVLWEGAAFTVAVQAYNDQGNSGYSNIELFIMDYSDDDNDGITETQGDCNDSNATIYPGALEVCGDGIDQDCSGSDLTCSGEPNLFSDTVITYRTWDYSKNNYVDINSDPDYHFITLNSDGSFTHSRLGYCADGEWVYDDENLTLNRLGACSLGSYSTETSMTSDISIEYEGQSTGGPNYRVLNMTWDNMVTGNWMQYLTTP